MLVLVCGGRNYDDRPRVWDTLDALDRVQYQATILHGACGWDGDKPDEWTEDRLRGADRLAHEWAVSRRRAVQTVAARWTTLGRGAGPIRNAQMLTFEPSFVVAFPGGAGTANMVGLAERAGLRIMRIG